jgi:hypothetical protein
MELQVDDKIKQRLKAFGYYMKFARRITKAYTVVDFYEGEDVFSHMESWRTSDYSVNFKSVLNIEELFQNLFSESDLWNILFDNVYDDINYSKVYIYIDVDKQKVWFDAKYESYTTDDSSSEGEISESWMERLEGRGVYTARYSGGGDSGDIDSGEFNGDDEYNGTEYENYAYDILSDEYVGWEIDNGSSGKITINTIEGTWEIEHSWYETEMFDAENEDVYFYF